jgi:hypothetical protein
LRGKSFNLIKRWKSIAVTMSPDRIFSKEGRACKKKSAYKLMSKSFKNTYYTILYYAFQSL